MENKELPRVHHNTMFPKPHHNIDNMPYEKHSNEITVPDTIVRYYKACEDTTIEGEGPSAYDFCVLAVGKHAALQENLVFIQSLKDLSLVYAYPMNVFVSEVNLREHYKYKGQRFLFEKVDNAVLMSSDFPSSTMVRINQGDYDMTGTGDDLCFCLVFYATRSEDKEPLIVAKRLSDGAFYAFPRDDFKKKYGRVPSNNEKED